jgi:ABC-2 type transport system ATP-binding protein
MVGIEKGSAGGNAAIEARHLRRVYVTGRRLFGQRKEIVAVEDISFSIPAGTIFGLLGPNGAGKTTTIKMLSTLLLPTGGSATVGGYDVVRHDRLVRRNLGVVLGGDRGLYAKLTARQNLVYFGNLYGMTREAIEGRTDEMLDLVGLRDRADERVEGFSRGMKQRVHLAKALLHDPPILILDEPSIGLDPAAAVDLRRAVAALVPDHTILLTTHDMHEADSLCAEIAIVDAGQIVAQGTPEQLKAGMAGDRRLVITADQSLNGRAQRVEDEIVRLPQVRGAQASATPDSTELTVLCSEPGETLDAALAVLRRHQAAIRGVRVIEPTLEDVFLATTGRSFE